MVLNQRTEKCKSYFKKHDITDRYSISLRYYATKGNSLVY